MDFPVFKYKCTCGRCGAKFTIETSCGPSRLCHDCTVMLLEIVWGCRLAVNPVFRVVEPVRKL